MTEAIGGYFELADRECGKFPHCEGVLLNTGRNALEYILRATPDIRGIWLPYYTCGVLLEPIRKLHIPYFFYHINSRFEIADRILLGEGQYLIATNYFGLKDAYIKHLYQQYGEYLIVDCTQAFFSRPRPGMKAFYSCRKFVGVPDGGIAYGVDAALASLYEMDDSLDHCSHLLLRKSFGAEAGYQVYRDNEYKLSNRQIGRMSAYTKDILDHINYDRIVERRQSNFDYLSHELNGINLMDFTNLKDFSCPMVYPFYTDNVSLRKELITKHVYVAQYWPNVLEWCASETLERKMAIGILPLPIDQRYGKPQMNRIIEIIRNEC